MASIQIDIKDGLSSSVAVKGPCRVATTANITLSGEQTIDGVAVVTDDRVLVKSQTAGSENGIYVVDTGAWRRAKDFSKSKDIKTGTVVNVVSGSAEAGWWEVTTTGDITVGTTSLAFARTILAASQMIDEDDMASNSDTKVPTQQSVKAYVDAGPSTSALQATMRDRLDVAPYVASIVALQALNTAKDTVAVVTAAGVQHRYLWTAGNFSSQITAADPRYAASSADPTGAAGAWIRSGTVETGQFFESLGAQVHRLADRVLVGNAVNNKANPVASQTDWLTTFLLARGRSVGFLEFSQLGVLNNSSSNSANAIVSGSQTSVLAGVGNSIGGIFVGVNNNSSFATNAYGQYVEAYKMSGATGGAYGLEIDTINYDALATTNPFAQASGQTVGIQLAGGAGLSAVGQFDASVGINFWNNNAAFAKGINFGFTSITGTNGTDGNTGEAIAMATGHAITYYYGSGTKSWTLKANIGVNGNYVFSTTGTGGVVLPKVLLPSGGVIDFNSGDVTITHSADALAFGGAANGYTFDQPVKPSANDGAALGSTALQWSDIFVASGAVLNFANGNYTITHSSGNLSFNGAVDFTGAVLPTASGTPSLGSGTKMWANLFLKDGGVINFNNGGYTITHSTNLISFSQAIFTTGGMTAGGNIRTNNPGAGIGYSTGAGGTVTQATSRTTGVTLNTSSGAITMFTAAGSATPASFTVTNSSVAATDTIVLNIKSGATNTYFYFVTAVAAGSFVITFWTTGGTASDTPVISFNLIKGVTS